LEKKLIYRQNVGFHWRDFPETSHIALSKHSLKNAEFDYDRTKIQSTLTGEKYPAGCITDSIRRMFLKLHIPQSLRMH
jgi:hypothetical protein